MLLFLLACTENNLVSQDKGVGGDDTASDAPDIRVTPDAVDFGVLSPGDVATATVHIENRGDAQLLIGDLLFTTPLDELTLTGIPSPAVAPGAGVDTVVTWTAGVTPLADTLQVGSNDPDQPRINVPITGEVVIGDILVEPAFYDFGTLPVGTSASVPVVVSNIGDGPLTIDAVEYATRDGDLHVTDYGALATLPAILDVGASTTVTVEYTPSSSGGDEGAFTVWSDDPDTPTNGAQQAGTGADDPCNGYYQTVRIMLTADDAWQGWIDGTSFSAPGQNTWSQADTLEWEMACGDHALSLYATDTANVISGVIAVVWVEDAVRFVSGPANWTMLDTPPPGDWTSPAYDDSSWHIPVVCANTSPWGTWPQPFYDLGAQWIWWTSNCSDLGEAWLRLNFTVP